VSDFEDLLRRAMSERAASVRTAPDERDVMRRIRRAERASTRTQRAALVAALVVVAGSAGGVLGAVASRPAGVPLVQSADSPGTGASTSEEKHSHSATPPPAFAGASEAGATAGANAQVPAVQQESLGGVSVDWLTTPLEQPVLVVPGSGQSSTCSKAAVVSLTVAVGAPVASASGVVGLPSLQPDGLAVVSSGSFATSHGSGWWAIVEAGSAAQDVAVQFPSGAVVRAPVASGGVAVVASTAPAGSATAGSLVSGSAVADGATRAMGSLEFFFGGGIEAVDLANGPTAGSAASGCAMAAALTSGGTGLGRAAGPPAALVAAGDVVSAYAQAYDVDPLLGWSSSFAAVDLGSSVGCPVESLPGSTIDTLDGLAAPAVQVEAVAFTSTTAAIVVYKRTGKPLLETGTATLVDGTWKVGSAGYCSDLQASAASASPAG
jgi:hypothetical protein